MEIDAQYANALNAVRVWLLHHKKQITKNNSYQRFLAK
jgi:hypothetical protein